MEVHLATQQQLRELLANLEHPSKRQCQYYFSVKTKNELLLGYMSLVSGEKERKKKDIKFLVMDLK